MTLTDTGPLVALLRANDSKHELCRQVFARIKLPMVTTMPCLSEAMHFPGKFAGFNAQDELWGWVADGVLVLHREEREDLLLMRELMRKYADTPMDLADASLVAAAQSLGLRQIFTVDSDFYVFRLDNGSALEVLQ